MPNIIFIHVRSTSSSRWMVTYSFGPWVPCTANLSQRSGLRSPDRVKKEVLSNRLRTFRLGDPNRH